LGLHLPSSAPPFFHSRVGYGFGCADLISRPCERSSRRRGLGRPSTAYLPCDRHRRSVRRSRPPTRKPGQHIWRAAQSTADETRWVWPATRRVLSLPRADRRRPRPVGRRDDQSHGGRIGAWYRPLPRQPPARSIARCRRESSGAVQRLVNRFGKVRRSLDDTDEHA
jgi:hypothetical protein